MPLVNSLVVNNAASVAHTFTSIGKDKAGVLWFEQTVPTVSALGAIRIGYKQERGMPGGNSKGQGIGRGKAIITIAIPTLEALGTSDSGLPPPPTISYRNAARLEFDLAERGTKTERQNLRTFASLALQNSNIVAAIDDMIPMF